VSGPTRRALLVVAHPDDETFGAGSVIASLSAAGVEVVVCCATRGEVGEAHGVPAGVDLAAVREAELRAAGAILGVADFALLGYLDSGMVGDLAEGSLVGAPLEEVVGRVRAVVEDVDPELVITLDPVNSDGHRDHVRIGQATTEACRDRARTRLYYWTVSREMLRTWFAELARVQPDAGLLALDLDRSGVGRPDVDITTVLDVSAFRGVRERAVAAHRSQRSPMEGMPEHLVDAYLSTDLLVRVQPPWPGGELERSLL
jgi:N-acetyl-1-D-myo-inositol-2-amino-2-deoxy-alpha-D-glucopyranoside deacetylase